MRGQPVVAVVAPLTGPRAAWGAVLLDQVERARAEGPGVTEWHVHDETPGTPAAVAAGGYAAVVGHSDRGAAREAAPAYREAGVPCLLPFVRAGDGAGVGAGDGTLSWAPDEVSFARTVAEGAAALGAGALAVVHDADEAWAGLAHRVHAEATAAGLDTGPGTGPAGALVVLAAQDRVARFLPAPGAAGPVLVPVDCGVPAFASLTAAARGRAVWAVHPQTCAVRRARTAVTALTEALRDGPALRGAALSAAVRARSGSLLTASCSGVLGDGWRVSRVPAVCPARAVPSRGAPTRC
ncbi:hypothetical protein [Streptomyces ficellus]|uniref:Leucine-binding protein domain-containing protein n=1 Tax=Streptomyces ficellus TaxID=1977088 RepID=A0A6I6F5X9_9ACTN|nr:hypothetical protein [Streptomyces ficellus]QGV79463.1 hypothetical protein EIZ62_15330 [Streptomyces ficellus]